MAPLPARYPVDRQNKIAKSADQRHIRLNLAPRLGLKRGYMMVPSFNPSGITLHAKLRARLKKPRKSV